jgi:hypothetical protein
VGVLLIVGAAALALLIWAGRRPSRVSTSGRVLRALFAALAAVAAVVSALKGGWIGSLALVALSAVLGQGARLPPGAAPSVDEAGMSEAQARSILGVSAEAGRDDILEAYRRLMLRTHPDRGGSAGLAAQINAARDRLLGKSSR